MNSNVKAALIATPLALFFTGIAINNTITQVHAKKEVATAAAPKAPKHGRNEAIAFCEFKLERTLRDPGSVRYDRNLTAYSYEDGLHKVALVYNAKNGFGGYAGQDIYTCAFK